MVKFAIITIQFIKSVVPPPPPFFGFCPLFASLFCVYSIKFNDKHACRCPIEIHRIVIGPTVGMHSSDVISVSVAPVSFTEKRTETREASASPVDTFRTIGTFHNLHNHVSLLLTYTHTLSLSFVHPLFHPPTHSCAPGITGTRISRPPDIPPFISCFSFPIAIA